MAHSSSAQTGASGRRPDIGARGRRTAILILKFDASPRALPTCQPGIWRWECGGRGAPLHVPRPITRWQPAISNAAVRSASVSTCRRPRPNAPGPATTARTRLRCTSRSKAKGQDHSFSSPWSRSSRPFPSVFTHLFARSTPLSPLSLLSNWELGEATERRNFNSNRSVTPISCRNLSCQASCAI